MGIKGDYIHKARLAVSQELVTKAIISAPSRGQQDRVCQPHSNQASEQRPAAFPPPARRVPPALPRPLASALTPSIRQRGRLQPKDFIC